MTALLSALLSKGPNALEEGGPRMNENALTTGVAGAPGEIRTPNLLIRSQMLYPLSYECSCATEMDNEQRV